MAYLRFLPLLTFAALSVACKAQEAAPPKVATAAPAAPSAAQETLQKALRFTQSLPALRCKAKATFVMPEFGEGIQGQIEMEAPTVDVELTVAMPNRIALRGGEPFGGVLVCDGKQVLQVVDQFQLYSLGEAPKDLLSFLGKKRGPFELPGLSTLRALLAPSGSKRALIDAKQVEVLGEEKVDGRDCVHLAVRDEKIACELWIAKGDEPWVVRHKPEAPKLDLAALMAGAGGAGEEEEVVPTEPKEGEAKPAETKEGEAGGEDEDGSNSMSIQIPSVFDCTFTDFAKEPGKNAFAIEPPQDFEKVEDLTKAMQERIEADMGEEVVLEETEVEMGTEGPHPSTGKPVPAATLSLLDGSKVALADLKGKVVLLDFWASWCGPCVQGLPKIAEVAAKLKEQGVVFVAVNSGEDKATIEKFLAAKKLDLQVALGDDKLATSFGVRGIPHTVVIGRDGLVQAVHIGFAPGGEQAVEKDLRTALALKGDEPKKEEPKK